jgi:hypothetical protein
LLYGCGISNSNLHTHDNLPILLAGGADGRFKGGRHVRVTKDTPLPNLQLSILNTLGVPLDMLGDSTGRVSLVPEVYGIRYPRPFSRRSFLTPRFRVRAFQCGACIPDQGDR